MRIGIDLHSVTEFMQGSRTYIVNLVEHLLKLDKDNEYYLYITHRNTATEDHFRQENVHFRRVVPHLKFVRIPVSLPVILAKDKIDVFHCQYMAPPILKIPYVVAIHDIIHEYLPQYYPKTLGTLMRMVYPMSARRAQRVLTISKNSKEDLKKFYRIPENRIVVTYLAAADDFRTIPPDKTTNQVLARYGIDGEYVLFVGRLEPRKNISGLISAFHAVLQYGNVPYKLVIAGMKDYQHEQLYSLVTSLDLEKSVIFTGRVEDNDLPLLYNGASLFVYPSFAEGFGIPPLEAMACGVPVITSDVSSLPEVVGDAGILINPNDIQELSTAIYTVLSDKSLQAKMKTKGLARAGEFTWGKTAEATLAVLQDVYNETR